MVKKRAKAMLPAIRELITSISLSEDTDRNMLAEKLLEDIKRLFPKETPPTFETVIKKISAARNHEALPEDKSFNISDLINHDISPDAIPTILRLQDWLENKPLDEWMPKYTLTIREVLWISRLFRIIDDFDGDSMQYLFNVVSYYSKKELVSLISKSSFDTSEFDKAMRQGRSEVQKLLQKEIEDGLNGKMENLEAYLDASDKHPTMKAFNKQLDQLPPGFTPEMLKNIPSYLIRLCNILDRDPELRAEHIKRVGVPPFEIIRLMNIVGNDPELRNKLAKLIRMTREVGGKE
jgi:hypothetical protein